MFFGDQRGGVDRHDIRAIRKIGDLPKPLRLALSTEHPAGEIKPFKCRIFPWVDSSDDFNLKGAVREVTQLKGLLRKEIVFCADGRTRDLDGNQRQVFTVKMQRGFTVPLGIPAQRQGACDAGVFFFQIEKKIHRLNDEIGCFIVAEADRFRGSVTHGIG